MKHKTIQQLRGMGEQIQGGNEMSELKARLLGQTMNEYGCDTKIYLKSEADKVIEEKDEKIEELEEHIDELQKATDSAWSKVNVYYDELSHSNRMRCLTMAKWCAACRFAWSFMPDDDEVKAECKFYEKWKLRWLELAEKFKEEK